MFLSVNTTAKIINRFTTRLGGVSEGPRKDWNFGHATGDRPENIEENHRILMETAGLKKPVVTCHQVHGVNIAEVKEEKGMAMVSHGKEAVAFDIEGKTNIRAPLQADALYTEAKGLPVGVHTADCLPVIISDEQSTFVMAVHAGWRGVVDGIIEESARFLLERGKTGLEIILGPSIGPCCLELKNEAGLFHGSSVEKRNGSFYVDLKKEVSHKLRQSLQGAFLVHDINRCTCCEKDFFYSYRRDKITGRHLNSAFLQ